MNGVRRLRTILEGTSPQLHLPSPLWQCEEKEGKCRPHLSKKAFLPPQKAADINILFGSIFVS